MFLGTVDLSSIGTVVLAKVAVAPTPTPRHPRRIQAPQMRTQSTPPRRLPPETNRSRSLSHWPRTVFPNMARLHLITTLTLLRITVQTVNRSWAVSSVIIQISLNRRSNRPYQHPNAIVTMTLTHGRLRRKRLANAGRVTFRTVTFRMEKPCPKQRTLGQKLQLSR